mgnify:CR=1 FL=1|jgi:hypothetical protein
MGADQFTVVEHGKSANDAFRIAVENARWEHGHGGYTGTIAEKDSYHIVVVPEGVTPDTWVDAIMDSTLYAGGDTEEKRRARVADHLGQHDSDELYVRAVQDGNRVLDKWGPAGAIRLEIGSNSQKWMFFGIASC